MRKLKHLKSFESYTIQTVNSLLKHTRGNIVTSKEVLDYVKSKHRDLDDFEIGDLEEKILKYPNYKLLNVPISNIETPDKEINEDDVRIFQNLYSKTGQYPPIILDKQLNIIDGLYRLAAVKRSGDVSIKAYVGIGI
jgi:hypothetical protein